MNAPPCPHLFQLLDAPFGLPTSSFRFKALTLSSRLVCVSHDGPEGRELVVVDTHNDNAVRHIPTKKAELGIMNPVDNIVALQARPSPGSVLVQIFDLDSMSRLGEFTFGEEVVFWKWCGARFFAVVTTSNVYHWDLRTPESSPTLTFSRAGQLAESDVQIIDYATNTSDAASAKWALLTCISLKNGVITGDMQLYSLGAPTSIIPFVHVAVFSFLILFQSATNNNSFRATRGASGLWC